MHLIPTSGWWFARWSEVPPPLGAHLAIDVCTPSQFIDGIWTYDDLELDFVKSCGGSWQLIDQDEFDDEVGRGRVSIEESAAALRAVSELGARLDQHDEVFDTKGWDLLERCRRLEFPPIGGLS